MTPSSTPEEADHHELQPVAAHPAEWGYTGRIGPDHWADLDPSFALARSGRKQSPIDLRSADAIAQYLAAPAFDYHPWKVDSINLGHAIELVAEPGSALVVGSDRYELEQLHFHAPSEHTLDGEHTAMEMHLVHAREDGEVAVVAVMIQEGRANSAYDPICAHVPTAVGEELRTQAIVRIADLLPLSQATYRYEGSFTTPPCTEGIEWFVLRVPVEMSRLQIEQLRRVVDGNNRPVQPLNGRQVLTDR